MSHKIVKNAFLKAFGVTLFFLLVQLLYNLEFVRGKIEDIGFDIVNKIVIQKNQQKTQSPKILLFGFDNLYMQENDLFDEDNQTNYGYLFPRDKIANFIERVDILCSEIDEINIPKALFIDYDLAFTSMPYGKKLSQEDKKLLEVLKQKRPYIILIPKTETENFIEKSEDTEIQRLIKDGKIIFVSVSFLKSNDDVTRRYLAYQKYKDTQKVEQDYVNVDVALWLLASNNKLSKDDVKQKFQQSDIISNRFYIKSYKDEYNEDSCSAAQSYWDNYTKYSVNCLLFDIAEEDFSNAIIMLGGTYRENSDTFKVLDIGSSRSVQGVELHANVLMSIFQFNGQLKALNIWISTSLVFFIFFVIDLIVESILKFYAVTESKLYFLITLLSTVLIMACISVYLLLEKNIWFNWFVPVVIYEIFDIIYFINTKIKNFKQQGKS
jgi:CHASE2 domain-containing sensor protein